MEQPINDELPPILVALIGESEKIVEAINDLNNDKGSVEEQFDKIVPHINSTGKIVNQILDERLVSPAIFYNVLYQVILKIKKGLNLLPCEPRRGGLFLTLMSLGMFLMNTIVYFVDTDRTNRLNTIALFLSEMLVSSNFLIDGEYNFITIMTENDNQRIIEIVYHFCAAIAGLVRTTLSIAPVVAKEDALLWTKLAMFHCFNYLEMLERDEFYLPLERSIEKVVFRYPLETVYLSIYSYSAALINFTTIAEIIHEMFFDYPDIINEYENFSTENPTKNLDQLYGRSINVIKVWINTIKEEYENNNIDPNNAPYKSIDFVISTLGLKYLEFNRVYNNNIIDYFMGEQKQKKQRQEYLEKIIEEANSFLSLTEEILGTKADIIQTPYYSTYSKVLLKKTAITNLLVEQVEDMEKLLKIQEELEIVANIVQIESDVDLFITLIIVKSNIAYSTNDLEAVKEINEEIKRASEIIAEDRLYPLLTLKMFYLLNRIVLETIELEELENELDTISKEIIYPFLNHLREDFERDKDLLTNIIHEKKTEISEQRKVNPLKMYQWFTPQYWKLEKMKEQKNNEKIKMYLNNENKINWAKEEE